MRHEAISIERYVPLKLKGGKFKEGLSAVIVIVISSNIAHRLVYADFVNGCNCSGIGTIYTELDFATEPAEIFGRKMVTMSPLQAYDLGHSGTGGVRCHNQVGI